MTTPPDRTTRAPAAPTPGRPTAVARVRSGATRARRPRQAALGAVSLVVGVAILLGLGFLPAPYVIRQPGPVFNAIGSVALSPDAEPTDVITITGADHFEPSAGELTVMTVNIAGNPTRQPNWFESFLAFVDPTRDVLPVEAYFPPGETTDQRDAQNQVMMQSSQSEAIASALRELGYEFGTEVVLSEVSPDGPSAGVLDVGDVVVQVGDVPIADREDIRAALEGNDGTTPVPVTIERDGVRSTVDVVPTRAEIDGETRPVLGVNVSSRYDFPVQVDIELGDVGGPSAGLVFTLAIIDEMTPGDLTGGHLIAGTGTMAADGTVGPIGGIRQKLFAADAEGAEAFLVPVENCAEALDGGVPGELPLYAVADLGDGLAAVEAVASGSGTDALTTCQDVVGAG